MISPTDIVDGIVTDLKLIPEFVEAMGGVDAIYAYHDHVWEESSASRATLKMPQPGCMVLWRATADSFTQSEPYQHRFSIILRGARGHDADGLVALIMNGQLDPADICARFRTASFAVGCNMLTGFNAQRMTDMEGLDYIELTFQVPDTNFY